ncbi:hypothetical protein M7I_2112 [Glarea lozoyensis 74030]|uniref:Uncharacterized protein n=1 Tax=Glarea lozoyensis (strain ATCC 74030 / MF5533) TaxID=1104152 RepID=H0EHW9_GLAL7|nr:hypothetical protein M7I_2112 [Glarea lozoyensis 74030]
MENCRNTTAAPHCLFTPPLLLQARIYHNWPSLMSMISSNE